MVLQPWPEHTERGKKERPEVWEVLKETQNLNCCSGIRE